MSKNVQAIILAAGKSTRFNTQQSKLIEKICGQEMILYITKLLTSMDIQVSLVVGYQKEVIESLVRKNHVEEIKFIHQKEQLGTGHALLCTEEIWQADNILILNGDMPLINSEILESLFQTHLKNNADITFVTAHNIDPSVTSYGRVVHDEKSIRIVEAKDDKEERKDCYCINAGIYLAKKKFLQSTIHTIEKSRVTGEFYITDLIGLANDQGYKVCTISAPFDSIRGINTFQELWAAEQIKRAELIKYWMNHGIRFTAAQNNHIDLNVTIGAGTYVGASVQLFGTASIGKNCKLEAFSIIKDSAIEDNVTIKSHSVIENSIIKNNACIGPFAHVLLGTIVSEKATIGNFVEIKRSSIGSETKIKHLSYIGDAELGKEVNIGAGTITCNHNGITKEKTIIKDKAYIGSNNSLIAPVTIGNDSFTAAGSVITNDVPQNSLAIARAYQVNKENYALKLKQKPIIQKIIKEQTPNI